MHKARARGRRSRFSALSGRARQAHLRTGLQGSLAGLDQAPDHADQREPAEPRRLARSQLRRGTVGEALLRLRRRRRLRLRTPGQVGGPYFRAIVLTPVLVPSRSTSAPRRANSPLVTTPVMLLMVASSSTGLSTDRPRTSRTTLPLSVVKPSRSGGCPPSLTI